MRLLGAATHTLSRSAGSYVAGVWTAAAPTTNSFIGSIQPLSSRDLERLPEGLRARATDQLFTAPGVELRTASLGATPAQADVIIAASGVRYEVAGTEDWSGHAAPTAHRRYILARLENDEEAVG